MVDENEINYKTLRRIQQGEQTTSLLNKLHTSFYPDLALYIQNLEKIVEKETAPQKLKLFTDETQNTKKIANSIYELREKKIVQAALATVRGGTPDLTNMLDIEKKLYNSLVEQISCSRKEIYNQSSQKDEKNQPSQPKQEEPNGKVSNSNPIVRVVEDTPEFVGTDEKTYWLRKEDVLSLPAEMKEPLLKKGVVKQIK